MDWAARYRQLLEEQAQPAVAPAPPPRTDWSARFRELMEEQERQKNSWKQFALPTSQVDQAVPGLPAAGEPQGGFGNLRTIGASGVNAVTSLAGIPGLLGKAAAYGGGAPGVGGAIQAAGLGLRAAGDAGLDDVAQWGQGNVDAALAANPSTLGATLGLATEMAVPMPPVAKLARWMPKGAALKAAGAAIPAVADTAPAAAKIAPQIAPEAFDEIFRSKALTLKIGREVAAAQKVKLPDNVEEVLDRGLLPPEMGEYLGVEGDLAEGLRKKWSDAAALYPEPQGTPDIEGALRQSLGMERPTGKTVREEALEELAPAKMPAPDTVKLPGFLTRYKDAKLARLNVAAGKSRVAAAEYEIDEVMRDVRDKIRFLAQDAADTPTKQRALQVAFRDAMQAGDISILKSAEKGLGVAPDRSLAPELSNALSTLQHHGVQSEDIPKILAAGEPRAPYDPRKNPMFEELVSTLKDRLPQLSGLSDEAAGNHVASIVASIPDVRKRLSSGLGFKGVGKILNEVDAQASGAALQLAMRTMDDEALAATRSAIEDSFGGEVADEVIDRMLAGTVSRKALDRLRANLPPEAAAYLDDSATNAMLDLMGRHADPTAGAHAAVAKTVGAAEKIKTIEGFTRDENLGKYFGEPGRFADGIAAPKEWGLAEGTMVDRKFKAVLDDAFDPSLQRETASTIARVVEDLGKLAGRYYVKGNYKSYLTSITGNKLVALANGDWKTAADMTVFADVVRAWGGKAVGPSRRELRADYIRHTLGASNPSAGLMDTVVRQETAALGQPWKARAKAGVHETLKRNDIGYAEIDENPRMLRFRNERQRASSAFPEASDEGLSTLAGRRAYETSLSIERAPHLVKQMAKKYGVGNWTAISFDSLPTTVNIIKTAAEEIRVARMSPEARVDWAMERGLGSKVDPGALVRSATQRLTGLVSTLAAMGTAAAAGVGLVGGEPEATKASARTRRPWAAREAAWVAEKGSGNAPEVAVNLSRTNPWQLQFGIALGAARALQDPDNDEALEKVLAAAQAVGSSMTDTLARPNPMFEHAGAALKAAVDSSKGRGVEPWQKVATDFVTKQPTVRAARNLLSGETKPQDVALQFAGVDVERSDLAKDFAFDSRALKARLGEAMAKPPAERDELVRGLIDEYRSTVRDFRERGLGFEATRAIFKEKQVPNDVIEMIYGLRPYAPRRTREERGR